jgi:AcrR family transcriptional regulator
LKFITIRNPRFINRKKIIDKKVNAIYNVNMIYKNEVDLPKNRRRKAQIEKILDTAMKIVAGDGSEPFTMQNLANKLDFTAGALYRYYSSKDQIIAELEIRCIEEFNDLFDKAKSKIDEIFINDDKLKAVSLIIVIGGLLGRFAFEEPAKFAFLTNAIIEPKLMANEPETLKVAAEFKKLFIKISMPFFEAIIKKTMSDGNAAERALVYISALQGVLQLKKVARVDQALFDLESLRGNLTLTLLLGWGVSQENLQKAKSDLLKFKVIE